MVAVAELPLEIARLHWSSPLGTSVSVSIDADAEGGVEATSHRLTDLMVGGGFTVEAVHRRGDVVEVTGERARSLPDTVAPGMRVLVCGLNPSEYAADRGVGYARPGNRFWPAAVAAGLVSVPHDPLHALRAHHVGMTDLVKRATPRASALSAGEYRSGAARVERLVRWLRPGAVCFVGLEGWRAAVDRRARAGPQPEPFAGRPAYVMPSTSGVNAHATMAALTDHLRAAAELAR